MIRRVLFALILALPNGAAAQCAGASFWDRLSPMQQDILTEQVIATPYGTGNFWTATRGDTVLTIAGTMHLPDTRHDAYIDLMAPRLAQAELLLVEFTLDDQTAMQIHMSRNPDLITLPSDRSLPEELDAQTWETLSDAALARGVPPFIAAKMQPWFLSLTLAIPPCAMSAIASGQGGLDTALMERANTLDIPIAALEPWEDMLALLSSGTLDKQLDMLRIGIMAQDIQDEMLVSVIDLYFAEQSAMAWYLSDYTKDYLPPEGAALFDEMMAEIEDLLLIQRNANWIPVIEDAAATHDTIFIGFGGAHLFGETGVLRLLELGGWTILPI